MVHRSKQGLIFPEEPFDKLRPYREELLAMSQTYRAGGPEYMALSRAVIALDEAAGVVMSKPGFFFSPWHKT
ncbi:hypothetical protein [Aquidulcibacter sp.]|jgi:hypothetical protein|uniref:hypothetical protein n=1 Tax=Aquidulcibacter sp. TaxID=2052990 RepID=UPI0037BF3E79